MSFVTFIFSIIIFFPFSSQSQEFSIVHYKRYGSDFSCSHASLGSGGLSTEFRLNSCFYYNGQYSKMAMYNSTTLEFSIFDNSACSTGVGKYRIGYTLLTTETCLWNPVENTFGKYEFLLDDPKFQDDVFYEVVYKSLKCEGEVQYYNFISTSTESCIDYEDDYDETGEFPVVRMSSFYCGEKTRAGSEGLAFRIIHENKTDCFRTNDTSKEKEVIFDGCELGASGVTSSEFLCGQKKSELEDDKTEHSKYAVLVGCFAHGTDSVCSFSEEYEFVFEMEYECLYDINFQKWFKYERCNEREQIITKAFYTSDFCQGNIIEYYYREPLIEGELDVLTRLYCDFRNSSKKSNDIVLDTFYDNKCLIPGDRTFNFPVRTQCEVIDIDLIPGEASVAIALSQGCFPENHVGMEALLGECVEGRYKVFSWLIPAIAQGGGKDKPCVASDPFLTRYIWGDRLRYVQVSNSEFCRTCYGDFHYNHDTVCSGNGQCVEGDVCVCKETHGGPQCVDTYATWMTKQMFRRFWWVFPVTSLVIVVVTIFTVFVITMWRVTNNRKMQVKNAPKSSDEDVVFIFTDVENSTNLYESIPGAMARSMKLHDALMREQIEKYKGYEVKTIGDAFFVVFKSVANAVNFALEVQRKLPHLAYPRKLLRIESCAEQLCDIKQEVKFRGLRVRMGIHVGKSEVKFFNFRNQYDYFGNSVNYASRVESSAPGGRIFISDALKAALDTTVIDVEYEVQNAGMFVLKGISDPQRLWCLFQNERRFNDDDVSNAKAKKVLPSPGSSPGSQEEEINEEETDAIICRYREEVVNNSSSSQEAGIVIGEGNRRNDSTDDEAGFKDDEDLENGNFEEPKASVCCICLSRQSNLLYLPCKHISQCIKCPKQQKCPICRQDILDSVQSYIYSCLNCGNGIYNVPDTADYVSDYAHYSQ